MRIKVASISDCGGRSINDDTVRIRQEHSSAWAFVGDGLGGYAGGQQASQAAAEALMKVSRKGSLLTDAQLISAANLADQAVRKVQKDRSGKMKTTLVFLIIDDGQARWMHVGDSRLYHFHGGKIQHQTMDHSVSQMAVLMGEITPHQIRFHEDRNRVLRALGGESAKPDLAPAIQLTEGKEAFLLCTDGFWEYVFEEEMEQTLSQSKDPQQWLDKMLTILHSRTPADNDNFTAAVVFC